MSNYRCECGLEYTSVPLVCLCGRTASNVITTLQTALAEAVEILRESQWGAWDNQERDLCCVFCGNWMAHGHDKYCRLAAFLETHGGEG